MKIKVAFIRALQKRIAKSISLSSLFIVVIIYKLRAILSNKFTLCDILLTKLYIYLHDYVAF